MSKRTILIYGRSNSGKTAQLGELAEYVYATTGKRTRLYTGDKGGFDTIQPYVDLKLIEVVEAGNTNPFIFLSKAVDGKIRDANGKWVPGKNDDIGLWAFESLRAFAESMMGFMADQVGKGINIGGGSNVSFQVKDGDDTLKVGGGNMSHYGVAQTQVTDAVWRSFHLPSDVVWTSSVSKDDDITASGKVIGPDVIGKALTTEVPRWFKLTFRLDVLPAQMGNPERHLLYLGTHSDVGAGGAAGLGNIRLPLDSPKLDKLVVEPASIVKALELIEKGSQSATDTIRKRLGSKLKA